LPDLPKALVDLVRLKSGKLQDDVSVFVAAHAAADADTAARRSPV
jgi:hypothetical protein